MLRKSLSEQVGVYIETIFFNNKFDSAAASFNYALQRVQSNYLVFTHQDMMFTQPDFLKNLIIEIDKEKNALYGLCGTEINVTDGKSHTYSNVYHGLWNRNVGIPIQQRKRVNGLDEIFIAFHREMTKYIQFDPVATNGWHLYVEDLCLSAELQKIPVYVLPFSSQHKSVLEMPGYMRTYGILPKEYFQILRRLRKKYVGKVDRVVCPCITISTSTIPFWKKYLRESVHHRIKKFFRDLSFI